MPDGSVDTNELKNLLTEQGKAFEAYKAANDAKLDQLAKKGTADVVTVEQVKKIDDALNDTQEKLQAANLKLAAVEKMAARPHGDGKAEKDAKDADEMKNFIDVLRKGIKGQQGIIGLDSKDMTVGSDPDGGYYVPPSFIARIVERIFETTPVRQYATVMQTAGDDIEFLNNTTDIVANWVNEQDARTKTTAMKPGKIRIPVHEAYAMPQLSQKLLDDAYFNLESYLAGKIGDRLSRLENAAFVVGTGVGQPTGVTNYTALSTDDGSRAWGKTQYVPIGFTSVASWLGGTNPGDVLATVMYKMKTDLLNGAVWLMARECLTAVRQLKNSVGGYLWQPNFTAGQPSTLMDYPVVIAPDMPAVASASLSIAFANLREAYTIVDRIGLRMLRDPYTAKPDVAFYTTKRVGGDLVNFEAVKFLKFSAS